MNVGLKSRRCHDSRLSALTRLEVIVTVAALLTVVLVGLAAALTGYSRSLDKSRRSYCVNNLKNIGLAFRIFAKDQEVVLPWNLADNEGGTKNHATSPAAIWRHWAAISNEISHPKLFICPSDRERRSANSWSEFTNNRFVSYALGFSATEESAQSILAADRNIRLDGAVLTNVILSFPSNVVVTFDQRLHNEAGNLLLGDGSVQRIPSRNLSEFFLDAHQANGTNVLAFP